MTLLPGIFPWGSIRADRVGEKKKISHVPSSPQCLSVPQEAPYFVKANKVDLSADINPLWADAENLLFLQPPLRINSACCQGSGDSGRHSHGEEEEGHSHHVCHRLLQTARATGAAGWEPPLSRCPTLLPSSNAPQALSLGMTD